MKEMQIFFLNRIACFSFYDKFTVLVPPETVKYVKYESKMLNKEIFQLWKIWYSYLKQQVEIEDLK